MLSNKEINSFELAFIVHNHVDLGWGGTGVHKFFCRNVKKLAGLDLKNGGPLYTVCIIQSIYLLMKLFYNS